MELMHGKRRGTNTEFIPVAVDDKGQVIVTDEPLASIFDTTSSPTYNYICEAVPGASVNSPVWRISRLHVASGVLQWAEGNADFSHIAANRAALTYY